MTPSDGTRPSGRTPLRPTASTTHNPTAPPATLNSLLSTNPHTRWTEKRGPVSDAIRNGWTGWQTEGRLNVIAAYVADLNYEAIAEHLV